MPITVEYTPGDSRGNVISQIISFKSYFTLYDDGQQKTLGGIRFNINVEANFLGEKTEQLISAEVIQLNICRTTQGQQEVDKEEVNDLNATSCSAFLDCLLIGIQHIAPDWDEHQQHHILACMDNYVRSFLRRKNIMYED